MCAGIWITDEFGHLCACKIRGRLCAKCAGILLIDERKAICVCMQGERKAVRAE